MEVHMFGVTVVTCTHIPRYAENIFNNYIRQNYGAKELILNNSKLDAAKWRQMAESYPDVSVFSLPEDVTVGACLNFAVSRAKYDYIANFDHDDYYGAKYLDDFMNVAPHTDAGLLGKKSHYVYIEDDKTLAIMHPGYENCYVNYIDGPTMFMKKSIFEKVSFIDNDIADCQLSWDCTEKGIKIYSVCRHNFAYIRKKDIELHTWKIDNDTLLNTYCTILGKVDDYKSCVDS
jgi:hypothetical protein